MTTCGRQEGCNEVMALGGRGSLRNILWLGTVQVLLGFK